MSTQPLKMPKKKPAEMSQKSTIKKRATPLDFGSIAAPTPAPTQKPLKKIKKQRATLVPEDEPTPGPSSHAACTEGPATSTQGSAWESPKDESPSGSDDREEPLLAMDGPEVQPPPARAPGDQQEEASAPDDPPSQLS
ncbi:hypothetical protein E2C01_061181 [Portunus trituberculatus]|uniref:Uncharacterized protein n=1 Tax=Portunus trituberculatus TaxID=210409 RepID=A0A5B7H368_PORTR|nr:hypothetical protein [Portunus trituberculatus]